jgi:hypothetical protein
LTDIGALWDILKCVNLNLAAFPQLSTTDRERSLLSLHFKVSKAIRCQGQTSHRERDIVIPTQELVEFAAFISERQSKF